MERVLSLQMLSELSNAPMDEMISTWTDGCSNETNGSQRKPMVVQLQLKLTTGNLSAGIIISLQMHLQRNDNAGNNQSVFNY